jgi:AcrR family transcriptional regulator
MNDLLLPATKRRPGAKAQPVATPDSRPPRERILNGAFAAFMELGYGKTSMLEIATRARVSKRDLYANFPDKGAILAACVETRARRMRMPLELPPPQDRTAFAETLVQFGIASLREGTLPSSVAVLRLAITETESDAARVFHAAAMESNVAALVSFLAKAQEAGLLRQGDVRRMAGLYLSVLWGNTLTRLLLRVAEPPSDAEMHERATDATRLLLRIFGSEG